MATLQKGKLLQQRYKLDERIAQGGFSVVWTAFDAHLENAKVAVKVYCPSQGMGFQDRELFEREYKLTKGLMDARLLKATDYFIYEDSPCLVFPYMDNGSVADKIKRDGTLGEHEIGKMIYQIGGALAYLHSQSPNPILHLDIKPENILIDYSNNYFLADFGISVQLRSTLLRSSSIKAATQVYMAPERVLGKKVGSPVDIFALGITILECCNGLMDAKFSLGLNLVSGIESLPAIDRERYTIRFKELIYRCLSVDPSERPSAAKLESYGRTYIEQGFWPELEESGSSVYPKKKHEPRITKLNSASKQKKMEPVTPSIAPTEQKKWTFHIAALFFLFLIGGLGVYWWMDSPQTPDLTTATSGLTTIESPQPVIEPTNTDEGDVTVIEKKADTGLCQLPLFSRLTEAKEKALTVTDGSSVIVQKDCDSCYVVVLNQAFSSKSKAEKHINRAGLPADATTVQY